MSTHAETLAELTRAAATRFGERIAVHSRGEELSFLAIERAVAALAAAMTRLGVQPRQNVVLHLPNSWRWIVAYYAIARIDAVVVPANILLVPEEIRFIADDCKATAIIAPTERVAQLQEGAEPPAGRLYIAVGDGRCAGAFCFEELLHEPPSEGPSTATADAVSTIGYTSGTTGRPKGAMLSHRAVVLNTAITANMHVRTASDVVVTALPCAHVYGNVVMNGAFLCGYTLVLLERFEAEAALEAIEQHRATLFEGVPTMYYYLLGSSGLGRRNLRSLTRATVGGQTMPLPQMHEVKARLSCPLIELWGMTEIAGLGTTHLLYAPERLGSIGQSLPLSECAIADFQEPAKHLPAGESGELLIRGPTVMRGYLDRPEATREVLLPGGWLRTGDVAYRDADGYFFIVDRVKEMIITAGYNIYPSEVERVIAAHPAVQMVAVGGKPDAAKGELAHAYVVLKANASVEVAALLDHCRSHLAAYKVPKEVHFVTDLPKTSTGKIMRRALRNFPS